MIRYMRLPVVVLIAGGLLVGCSSEPSTGNNIKSVVVDGTTCIVWKDGYAGGVSCDWGPQ